MLWEVCRWIWLCRLTKCQKGETVLGNTFFTTPGGKGANQAVAAARLGDHVHMVGCIGDDMLGKQILENLKHNHVNVEYVKKRTFRYRTHYTS